MMDKIKLIAGMFILLAVIGTTYYVTVDDPVYYCEDLNVVGLCWKLSNVNDLGTQTRCYYNESTPTKYKNCKSGWEEYIGDEFIGVLINYSGTDVDLNFSFDKLSALETLGIGKFEVRNNTCKTWDYLETYNCIDWDISEIQNCILWEDGTNSTCIDWETLEVRGDCLEFKTTLYKENCLIIDNSILDYNRPKISPCIKIDNYSCRANIFQENGINKDFIITYPEDATQTEIEILLNKEVNSLLDKIAEVQIERNKFIETTLLTGEISLNIE